PAALITFVCLLCATWYMGTKVPAGFIPTMDQGYAIIVIQLPDGASLARTDAVGKQVGDIARTVPGVGNAVQFAGFSVATFTNASNAGVVFVPFKSFAERE
ncbi:efflux RND transporter permease subunit, partial [Rhizobium ruizarguesonis]